MKFNQWFPDCIGDELLTNVDNKKLKKYCLTLKKSKQGKFASYSNTWQSHNLDIRSPILKELIIEFEKNLFHFKDILGVKNKLNFKVSNLWVNINGKGAMHRPHLHVGSILSGIYYISVPKNSGNTCFSNPNLFAFNCLPKNAYEKYTINNSSEVFYELIDSKLLIFPSHLLHYVFPNKSNQNRITISFTSFLV